MKTLALKTLCWTIAIIGFFVVVPSFLAWDYLCRAITDIISEGSV